MKQHIVNLTNYLISKNRFDEMFYCIEDPAEFVKHIKRCLCANDVRIMSPEKLGEIMCSFEAGDVKASKEEIFAGINNYFDGDYKVMLCELVSYLLALVIMERLCANPRNGIPKWEHRASGCQTVFRYNQPGNRRLK